MSTEGGLGDWPAITEAGAQLSIRNLITAAEAALVEFHALHDIYGCFPEHCPTAQAIHNLEIALATARLNEGGVFES